MTSHQNSNSIEDIELIKQLYSGINRNDMDFVMKLFDVHILRTEPESFSNSKTYQGITEVKTHFLRARNTWAEGTCEPFAFFPSGKKVVVEVHVKVRLKDNTHWIDAVIADGFLLKEGKIAEFHTFMSKQKAFEWAGLTFNP